ncbi:MAG: hypothetical protein JWM82_1916 [Myxococcales bacterium]|nr:hypothetical protein [Myxococcales bacterium]
MKTLHLQFLLAAASVGSTASFGCGNSDPGAAVTESRTGAVTTSVKIFGQVQTPTGVPIAGATIQLSGGQQSSAITDAFGAYALSVPAGTYAVSASKAGATLTPASANLTVSADTAQNFGCDAACGSATLPTIAPLKELMVVDPTVVGDARTSNAGCGRWSFCGLLTQLAAPGQDPADLAGEWAQSFNKSSLNTLPMSPRITTNLTNNWPKRADGKLDLTQAPFQLLAIANRTDLHAQGNGEGRFVFGMFFPSAPPAPPSGTRFTVIFEFQLPTTTSHPTRQSWVNSFHALSSVPFGASYNSQLQAITDQFTRAGAVPVTNGNPTGSALGQLRTNEVIMNEPWSLREFHLYALSGSHVILNPSPPAQAPDLSRNGNTQLAQFLTANRTNVILARQTIPVTLGQLPLIGGESLAGNDPGSPPTVWSFSGMDETLRHAFAGQTCDGCHNAETQQLDGFYLVSPTENAPPGSDGTARLAGFVTNIELPRRASFAQNRLTCVGGACAAGAEAAAPPAH